MAQREVTFSVEEAIIPEIVEAFCASYSYPAKVADGIGQDGNQIFIDNPETPQKFAKRQIKKFALEVANSYKQKKAQEALQYNKIDPELIEV